MDQQSTDEIRFFDYYSRIGRLRYFAYGMGMFFLIVPVLIVAGMLWAFKMPLLAGLLLIAAYLFMIIMGFVFGVRRLHDLGWSGWWILISGVSLVCSLLNLAGVLSGPLVALVGLAIFIFYLVLLFAPGTQGENRFGSPPPPNSAWVIAGAWSFIIVPFFGGILAAIAIPAYQDYMARSQASEGIQLAGGAEVGVAEYYQQHKSWPDKLESVYAVAAQNPAGRYVDNVSGHSAGSETYGVVSTMKSAGINRNIAGKSLEIWTSDGGNTWNCGPGGMDPLNRKYLPASCRDRDAP
jgi:uncharacterized membrane protein YhaH (DUF805 family)/Tfp pilus assembly major pilin PilA